MKRLLALTILALGIPTLMGSQVQDTKEIKPLNTVTPTDDDGDLCEKGITDYNGAAVICTQAQFRAMTQGSASNIKKYVLGKSLSMVDYTTSANDIQYFELDGRGNTITLKGSISSVVHRNVNIYSLFKQLSDNTTIKNMKIRQQATFNITTVPSTTNYNFYSILAGYVTSVQDSNIFENIDVESDWYMNHDQNAYTGGLFSAVELSGSAKLDIVNSTIKTKIGRTVTAANYSEEWNGGITGNLSIIGNTSSFTVRKSSIDSSFTSIAHHNVSNYSGGIIGRYNGNGNNTKVVVEANDIKYKMLAGRYSTNTTNNMVSYSGGIVGHAKSEGLLDLLDLKNNNINLAIDTHRGYADAYRHISGGIIADHTANNNSLLNIEGNIIRGTNKSRAVTESTLGGIIGIKRNQNSTSKYIITNNLIFSDIMAQQSTATNVVGRTVAKSESSIKPGGTNLYYISTMTLEPNTETFPWAKEITKEEMDYNFFSGGTTTLAVGDVINLNIDTWDIMPYTEFWNGNTLNLQLKWQAWAASPVENNLPNTPTIDIESFRFPDSDKVSPIVWVVGAILALLAGAYVWYKKRKSAY